MLIAWYPSVIGTLWRVRDDVTSATAILVYKLLLNGHRFKFENVYAIFDFTNGTEQFGFVPRASGT